MRKWQDLAAPDDPGSWLALSGMTPTVRGTYEVAPVSTAVAMTATGTGDVVYAFSGGGPAGTREYVATNSGQIWEWDGVTTLTDRGGATGGGLKAYSGMMVQYGDATIAVRGSANAAPNNTTLVSTGGNFANLSGAPVGQIICQQSNAVLIFGSSSADSWAASDVGDYTNWATGEAASGRIISPPGPITAATHYGNDVLVFKQNAIYRMTYVGGVIKWQIQLIWSGLGIQNQNIGLLAAGYTHAAVTAHGVVFQANEGTLSSITGVKVYLFDGASAPVRLNPLTTVAGGSYNVYGYDAATDTLVISPSQGSSATGTDINSAVSRYYYYSFASGLWGTGNGSASEALAAQPGSRGTLQGAWGGAMDKGSNVRPRPAYWVKTATNTLARCSPSAAGSSNVSYVQSSKYGRIDRKTAFSRLTPLMRRRTDLGSGTAVAHFSLFREREDVNAQTGRDVTESTVQKRFDLMSGPQTDNFAAMRVTWTNFDVEIDDFLVASIDAGAN